MDLNVTRYDVQRCNDYHSFLWCQGVNVKGYNHLLHTTVFRTHLLSPFIMYLYFDINLSCNRTSQYLFNCSPVVTLHLYEEIRKTLRVLWVPAFYTLSVIELGCSLWGLNDRTWVLSCQEDRLTIMLLVKKTFRFLHVIFQPWR